MMYKLDEPRISLQQLGKDGALIGEGFEAGQAASYNEAMFFLRIGYRMSVSRWDGNVYRTEENYYPADVE